MTGAVLPVAVLLAAGCGTYGNGSGSSTAPASQLPHAVLVLRSAAHAGLGSILVDPSGRTLYAFVRDAGGKVACTGSCAVTWPPLTVASGTRLSLERGLGGTLATLRRPDGSLQVAYDGHPLYRFAGDHAPGQVNGEGVAGLWYAVHPMGAAPAKTATTAGPGTGQSATTTVAGSAPVPVRQSTTSAAPAPPSVAPTSAPPATSSPTTAPATTVPPTTTTAPPTTTTPPPPTTTQTTAPSWA